MTAAEQLSILGCQVAVPKMERAGDRDQHLSRLDGKLRRELARSPSDLVVLPELASIDYSRSAFERLDDLAETLEGPSFAIWRQLARDCGTTVAYSFPRRTDDGFRIALAAVGPSGELPGPLR